jgi:8-oxo-dGTP pyrophosphatase MutT (NUDIX family)
MTIDLFQLGVKVLLQDQSGKLLLLKVATDGFTPPIAPYWDIPGGRVERHGSIVETLNREGDGSNILD